MKRRTFVTELLVSLTSNHKPNNNSLTWVRIMFMRLEPLISHTGILMTFYLSIIPDLQNFFHCYILHSWKLKRPQIQLRPHHFWTYTSNFVNSVLKFMINGTTSILKSYIFQICAAIYQLLLYMVLTSRNWFVMQGPVAIILISWNVIFIWETGYWTRAIKRFALFDLLKSLYSDTKILSKYIRLCRDDTKRWIFI